MRLQLSARMHSASVTRCVVTAPRRTNTAAARILSQPTGIQPAISTCYAVPHLSRVPPVVQQLPTAPATAAASSASSRDANSGSGPEFSLEECAQEIQRESHDIFLTDVLEALQQCSHQLPQVPETAEQYWMLVQCGEWQFSDAWAGAAPGAPSRAVLCFTPPFRNNKNRDYNVYAFALNYHGIPNGEQFRSPTELEGMTNKAQFKKFNKSCRILFNGGDLCAVDKFIQQIFGEGAIHIPKLAWANRSNPSVQLRQSSSGSSSSSSNSSVHLRSDEPQTLPSVQLRSGAAGSSSGATSTGFGKITGLSSSVSSTGSRMRNSPQAAPSVPLQDSTPAAGSKSGTPTTSLGKTTGTPTTSLGRTTGTVSHNCSSTTRSRSRRRHRKAAGPAA